MVGVAESQTEGTKPRGGTGSIQRQYDAVLLPRDETKTKLKLGLPSDLVLGAGWSSYREFERSRARAKMIRYRYRDSDRITYHLVILAYIMKA